MAVRDFEYVSAAFLTRFFVGALLLTGGVNKFMGGYMNFVDQLTGMFAQSWIPQVAISPIAYALPIIEIVLGILLVLGLWSDKLLLLAGLLFILFTIGNMAGGMMDLMAYNTVYLLVISFALYLHGYDDWRLGR